MKAPTKPGSTKSSNPVGPETRGAHGAHLDGANPVTLTPEEEAALRARDALLVQAEIAARQAFSAGNVTAARQILDGWANANPEDSSLLPLLADVCLKQGDYSAAYAYLAPFTHSGADSQILLRASTVTAHLGMVFTGQRAYCVDHILLVNSGARDTANWLPQGESPRAVEALSNLALGMDPTWNLAIRRSYLERTLTLDPGDPLACDELGGIELSGRHYHAASVYYEAGLARADGPRREFMRRSRDASDYLHAHFGG